MVVEPSPAPNNTASPTTASEIKDFHGGFFSVSSPVRTTPHTEPSRLRSPALRRSLRRSVQHSPAVQGGDAGRDSRSPLLLMAALNRSCRKSSHLSPACGDSMVSGKFLLISIYKLLKTLFRNMYRKVIIMQTC